MFCYGLKLLFEFDGLGHVGETMFSSYKARQIARCVIGNELCKGFPDKGGGRLFSCAGSDERASRKVNNKTGFAVATSNLIKLRQSSV